MDGLLNLNKPPGGTSFDLVRQVRRLVGEKHVGHGGTLDPLAQGVLPLFLGKATRLVEYLDGTAKTYRADLLLGMETDTYDREGRVLQHRDVSALTLSEIEAGLAAFHGVIAQVPPMYSAVHHEGQRLYDLARAGVAVEREARKVTIHRLETLEWLPPRLSLRITCSRGTYIRSLAYDLGRALGCGAILEELVRERAGPFRIQEAHEMEPLQRAFAAGTFQELLLPMDYPLKAWPALRLGPVGEEAALAGRSIPSSQVMAVEPGAQEDFLFWPAPPTGMARAYDGRGRFLAVVVRDEEAKEWRPRKVLASPIT